MASYIPRTSCYYSARARLTPHTLTAILLFSTVYSFKLHSTVYSFKVHDCIFVDNTNVRGTVRYLINSTLKMNTRMGIM